MKKISVMMIVMASIFAFGCGKMGNATGPSEATATENAAKSSANNTPILSFSPSQATVKVGDEATVEVEVESASDMFGIATTVLFDNDKLSFVKIEEGGFLKQQNPTFLMSAIAGRDPNQLVIGLSSLGHVKGVNGSGSLFRITFKALKRGQASINFVDTNLVSSTLEKVTPQLQSATIVIE